MSNFPFMSRRLVTSAGVALVLGVVLGDATSLGATVKDGAVSTKSTAVDVAASTTVPRAVYAQRVEAHRTRPDGLASHVDRLRYADALMHLGQFEEAIDELHKVEFLFPEAYINSIFLGRAYELAGNLQSARFWISRGLDQNPGAQNSSEWLHLAIVEARLALARNPDWLDSHSVLEKNTYRSAEAILGAIKAQLALQVEYQIEPDAIVCDLYFEAGVCATGVAARREFFAQSLKLGALRQPAIVEQERIRARAYSSVDVR